MTATVESLPGRVIVHDTPEQVADAVAEWVARRARDTAPLNIAVSGGATPRAMFERLASNPFAAEIDWSAWRVFFADERAVPPDHEASNYRFLHETLRSRVPLPAENVHRMEGERPDLDAAAADYSALLARELGEPPRLDVVLLGLGENGHTASLFPGTPALAVRDAWATRGLADYEPVDRITLTFPAINAARHVAFLVTGASKGPALRGVVEGSVPASRVRPEPGELLWFVDSAAAENMR